jgi:AmmeMemoRadiSam system protein A
MPCLSESERKAILELAHQAVEEAVCHNRRLQTIPILGVFERRSGVFVTLHVNKKLRGCIGVIQGREPLGESIVQCAGSAALEDPRFTRMRPEELKYLDVEVSLLSELELMRPEGIEIGKHGLLVEQGVYRGLLLPQVATEHHLDKEQFLAETCHKAGLRGDAWKNAGTRIYGFTCEIVAENASHAEK